MESKTPEKLELVTRSWKYGQKFTCLACGKGKFTADTTEQVCPKCGQAHQVVVKL
jgi:transcription elongation factor Elf1